MANSFQRRRLALDQNFPEPILTVLASYIPELELLPLRHIGPQFADLDDRKLLLALNLLEYDGLITNNYKMLQNPKEIAALMSTKLVVFAIEGTGHDPVRAAGAVLLDLPGAVKRFDEKRPMVFWLRPRNPQPKKPAELFDDTAKRLNRSPKELLDEVRVRDVDLRFVENLIALRG